MGFTVLSLPFDFRLIYPVQNGNFSFQLDAHNTQNWWMFHLKKKSLQPRQMCMCMIVTMDKKKKLAADKKVLLYSNTTKNL